ncbi:hypothetical protein ACTPIT_002398, partial [Enterococcus hirae]
MRKETIKTLQGDCHENEKNNEIGGPNNSIKKRNERIIEAYQTKNTPIAGLAERFGVSKRTIGNVTHSLKEQNLQQQSLTNETTKEKEDSNNQNIEAYLAGELWLSKLVNRFNGSARTILMKIKKVREQKEEMQYKTSSENEILQLDRNSFEQREELFDDSSNDSLTTDEIVEVLMEVDETLDSGKNLVDYVNGSNELAKQSNNDLFDDSSNDSLMTEEIVEALMKVDETLDPAKNLVDYVNGSNELAKQSNNDLFDDSSNDNLTTEEKVEALVEVDETLDPAKNLV